MVALILKASIDYTLGMYLFTKSIKSGGDGETGVAFMRKASEDLNRILNDLLPEN